MKKAGRILAGTLLGIAFAGAVGIYCWQYDVGGIQKIFNKQEEEEETAKYPKLKIPERKTYEIGEEIECEKLVWTITSAEIVEDYNSLDPYFHTRQEELKNPAEWVKQNGRTYFEEEIRFLVLKATVTNTSELQTEYTCSHMEFYNSYEEDKFEELYLGIFGADVKCVSKTGEVKEIQDAHTPFAIKGGETVNLEYVMEYSEYSGYDTRDYIYDLYLSTLSLTTSPWTTKTLDNKIHLNIAPKRFRIDQTEEKIAYANQRNIPEMKARKWVNLDMKQYQKEGFPTFYQKGDIAKQYEEEVTEENYLFSRGGIDRQISNVQVTDWEALPKDFAERGALQKMAERYEQSYGYGRDQMKILLLDVNITKPVQDKSIDNEHNYPSVQEFDFYENTYLYTRDENEKRWIFGTADDWLITANSAEGGQTGYINVEQMAEGQTVTLQAAYLLPPEIYNEGELYFNSGEYIDIDFSEQPIQKIRLK